MTDSQQNTQIARRLAKTYGLQIPDQVIASALTPRPVLPILLSRASFRPDVDVRTNQRAQTRRDRRNFLRAALGFAVVLGSSLILWNIATTSQAPPPTPTPAPANSVAVAVNNPIVQNTQPASSSSGPIANAANLPPGQSLIHNDPSVGPIILIHLNNGQFVAYSAICTHAGCEVQFDPSAKDIVCPCHGALYDPSHNAQVIRGPAPYPLQKIPIQYNSSTGNIYLTG
jgi:thiosulfate dehydrogenase [quinone] large subunit